MSHLGVMIAISAVLGLLVGGLAIPFAGALGVASKSAAGGLKDLPQDLRAQPLSERTRLLSSGGRTIATFYDENRRSVPLEDVAPIMRTAIVAIEDYRFYQHGALDLKGTLRAFLTNQAGGGVVQGGSSITQQMSKMTLLAQAKTSAERKAATDGHLPAQDPELRHAIAFEQNYSKDWILERYLNIAYFGDGAYGIQAAARHYFSKDAKDLDLREASLLAGLVKNPVGFDPTTYPDDREGAPQGGPRPDGRARQDHREPGHEGRAEGPRARGQPHPQRLRLIRGAVLLRLRLPLPAAATPLSARPSTSARRCSRVAA